MPHEAVATTTFTEPLFSGLLEGYQTFDAIGAVVIGGVIIISLNLKGHTSFEKKKQLIAKSGWIAGTGLFVIYAGLILLGSYFSNEIDIDMGLDSDMKRATLLLGISTATLGNIGTAFLSVLVALACFTTAVGITTGASDYFKELCNDSQQVYTITAIVSCVLGVAIGQLGFHYIFLIAIPVLKFIYPITIVLIFLNVLPQKMASPLVFRAVVLVTFLFGLFDALHHFYPTDATIVSIREAIPLGIHDFGWVLPAFVTFLLVVFVEQRKVSNI